MHWRSRHDNQKRLPDNDLIDAVVVFSNTDGGELYLGVEDDGTVTGLHASHMDVTRLAAFIANKTVPPISVRVELLNLENTGAATRYLEANET